MNSSILSTTVWRAKSGYFYYLIELITYFMILHYLLSSDELEFIFKFTFISIYASIFLLRTKDMFKSNNLV